MGHKKPEKEMEKQMRFNCDEKAIWLLLKEISETGWMDPNVLLKAFCATECNKANPKMKATEGGEIYVANKAFYPK